MWWNDIKEIKGWLERLTQRLTNLEENVRGLTQEKEEREEQPSAEDLYDRLGEILQACENTEREIPKLSKLVNPEELAYTYEKHIYKIESMMLEFKGCVSMARAAVAERKEQQKEFEELKDLSRISKDIYKSMQSFINAGNQIEQKNYFKLDAIYRKICEIDEEKPKKKGNSRKKVASNPSS